MKKTVTYRKHPSGEPFEVEYDTDDLCHWCGLPVMAASMGGPACCPWCDMGVCRVNRGCRVDGEYDPETGKILLPKKHYEKYHPEVFKSGKETA